MDNVSNERLRIASSDGRTSAGSENMAATATFSAAMNQQMQAASEVAQAISTEMLRYAQQRLQAHAENLQSLARCQTPQSVMEQHMAFIRSSAQQISQGMTSLFAATRGAADKQAS